MSNRVKNIVVSLSFILVLSSLLLANILLPHRDSSYTERRSFRRPDFSWEKLLSGRMFLEYGMPWSSLPSGPVSGAEGPLRLSSPPAQEHNDIYVLGMESTARNIPCARTPLPLPPPSFGRCIPLI